MTTHVLTRGDLRTIVQDIGVDTLMDETIAGIQHVLSLPPERVRVPARDGFHYHKPFPGLVEWMPSRVGDGPVAIKVVGYHPENPKRFGVPTIVGTISLYDTDTGHLTGLVDGTFLTAIRTGATSAIATRLMARPGSSVVGMIGCGAQAVAQLHALSRVMPIQHVLVGDKNHSAAYSLAERCRTIGLDLEMTRMDTDDIVANVDVLCTATSLDIGEGPLFDSEETKPWLHINAAGADFPGKTELARRFLLNSYVCPDHREQARQQGECQQLSDDEIGSDLDEIIRNQDAYSHLRDERTVFDSTGLAVADEVVASIAFRHARERSIGRHIEVEAIPDDACNPYSVLTEAARRPVA